MATIVAAAGGGAWQTDATWVGGVKPTAADDVQLDATSGNVTIDSGAVCRSLDCLGYTGTLTHTASIGLVIGDASAPAGGRALRLVAGMTYTAGAAAAFRFASTHASTQAITLGGKTPPALVYRTVSDVATSAVWQHTDAIAASEYIQHNQGTWDTNSQAVTAPYYNGSGTGVRTLTLGSSAITLSLAGTAWNAGTVTNLTVTANTATVTLTGAGIFNGGSADWNGLSVAFTGALVGGSSLQGGNFTIKDLTVTGTAIKTNYFQLAISPTITGTFTVTGNSATNRVIVQSSTLGTARTITAATTTLTNVDFRDITAAGAAAWTGTSVGNALGNTGITFTTPVTRYAVATGNVSGSIWSATSGGASGASVPLPQDNIICNAASGAITVTNDMPRMCADLTCTGYTGTLTLTTAPDIYGSVTLASGMTLTGAARITFMGRSSHTIDTAGKTSTWPFTINAFGGTYTYAAAYTSSADSATCIRITVGTLNDGGFSSTLTGAGAAFYMDAGTWTSSGTFTIASTTAATPFTGAGTVNHTGTIVLSGATATDRTFAGGSKTYNQVLDQNTSTGKLTITGQNTLGLTKTAAAACTLALPTSSGCTFTTFAVTGVSGAVLTLTGDVTKAEGTVSCDYLAISSSDATGGATFYAGANSTDGGSNTGWIFGAPSGGRPFKGGTATVKESDIEGALVIL